MKLPVEIFLLYSDVLLHCLKSRTPFATSQLSKSDRFKVWNYTPKGQSEPLFTSLFYKQTSDNKYFYRQVGDCEKGKATHGFIRIDLFLITAEFIGLHFPEDIQTDHLAPLDPFRAKVLLQVFLMEHMPEYWQAHKRQFQVFDEKTGEVQSKERIVKHQPINDETQKAKDAIMDYFDAVSSHQYETAWQIIDQNMQERIWKGSYDSFRKGYMNTVKISQIHIWDFSPSAKSFSCKVFYMDKVALHYSIDQIILGKMTLGQIDQFSEIVKKIISQANENGLQELKSLELFKIQEKTFAEYARYKCQTTHEIMNTIFPLEQTESIARLYEVVCSKNGYGYKIRSITPIKGMNLR